MEAREKALSALNLALTPWKNSRIAFGANLRSGSIWKGCHPRVLERPPRERPEPLSDDDAEPAHDHVPLNSGAVRRRFGPVHVACDAW
jgi:hypothetical protein